MIPIPSANVKEQNGRVEVEIVGLLEGEPMVVGAMKFPTKQSWTKFWGAVSRGAIAVPDIEVKLVNVPPEESNEGSESTVTKAD